MQGQTLLFEVIYALIIATDTFARQKHHRPLAKSAALDVDWPMKMTA